MKKAKFSLKILSISLLSLFVSLLAGCSGGGDGSGGTNPALNGTISGTAVKGPVLDATVTCFSINADGTNGNMMGTGQTDEQGNFSVPMGDYSGPVLCQMTGGNYMDEATGINMPMMQNDVMTCVIPSMSAGSTVS